MRKGTGAALKIATEHDVHTAGRDGYEVPFMSRSGDVRHMPELTLIKPHCEQSDRIRAVTRVTGGKPCRRDRPTPVSPIILPLVAVQAQWCKELP